jgi:hypothetical protein
VNRRRNLPCVEQLSIKRPYKVTLLFLFRLFMFRHFNLQRFYFQKFMAHSYRLQFLCVQGRGSTSFHLHELQLQRIPIMFLACNLYDQFFPFHITNLRWYIQDVVPLTHS